CMQCECNDHAAECDINGVCVGCTHNTTGPHCDQCLLGFYGDATEGTTDDCQLCPCPLTKPSNRFSPTCVLDASGQVLCDQSDQPNDKLITQHNTWVCVFRCASGFYGNPQVVECGCDVNGALSSQCNVTTGQCICRENVTGRTCDHCKSGFYGLQSGHGCMPCGCNKSGSLFESCDKEGQCQCVEGVTGHKCDRCSRGYYGFHDKGCIACGCDMAGTEETFCNATLGCVPAKTLEIVCARSHQISDGPSQKLNMWADFPSSVASSAALLPFVLYVCVFFQPGVSGRRCEECVSGWFGLSAENLDGCLQCFCSGLSQDCEEQGGLTRVYLAYSSTLPFLSLVSQSNLQGTVSGVYRQGSEMLLDTRQLNTSGLTGPLYWRLPAQFEGNQLLSYGGLLSYTVTFHAEDGSGLSNQEPQVLMRGGTLRKLAIYTDMVAPSNGVTTQHDIRLTEHKWKYFNSVSQRSVSHADFMSVLSNIEYIIIKASYGTRLQQSRYLISNITMEMAVEVEKSEVGNVARLIESCVCPPGYTGLSCQDCDVGYFRQPQSELSPQSKKSMFVRPCVRCRCNNHSEKCDAETGQCQDCKHHTSGQSCEKCASGYYGSVKGSIGDCSPCACPLLNNSFSPTCILEGAAGDFRCTACQPGYEGRYCERCSVGYYGNPSVPGGVCSQCSCSAWGSLHLLCDVLTGECECKDGVKGQSCNECEKRSIFQEGECVCDDTNTILILVFIRFF
uniref:Laminin, alpha 1 n=1 Tax=Maylandia zebra TaxID=106582 RepID=A0A3P9DUJ5_9CICH